MAEDEEGDLGGSLHECQVTGTKAGKPEDDLGGGGESGLEVKHGGRVGGEGEGAIILHSRYLPCEEGNFMAFKVDASLYCFITIYSWNVTFCCCYSLRLFFRLFCTFILFLNVFMPTAF